MGFFSWHTCDTDRTIANKYSGKQTFTVHMITPDGRVFTESNYDGYGEFGGKDFYELLAELNGQGSNRDAGIDLSFDGNPSGDDTQGVIYPKLVEDLDPENVIEQYNSLPNPKSCRAQGFFYDDEDEYEDEYEDEDEEYDDDENF